MLTVQTIIYLFLCMTNNIILYDNYLLKVVINRDVKNVIKQIKNVKKRFLFRKNKKRYKKRINTIKFYKLK